MGNNAREEIMDLNLNLEPFEPPQSSMLGLGSLLNELETAHGRIEERIRQLEAVTSRARQRQRWRQGQSDAEVVDISTEPTLSNFHSEVGVLPQEIDFNPQERARENGKFGKRDNSHLIAKALDMDTNTKQAGNGGGGFFDCNICLDLARDPILTRCGHLFCWPCFYQAPCAYSNVKECPVCKGEVTDASIIPIYGNGSENEPCKSKSNESCLKVPPRPQAPRIESMRQQIINQGPFSFPIEARIQQFNNIIGTVRERTRSQDFDVMEAEGNQHHHSLQITSLLPASISSLSSALTSAMDSAERLVEDLEAYINSNNLRTPEELSHADTGYTDSYSSQRQSRVPLPPPSVRIEGPLNIVRSENETRDTATGVNSIVPPASSSRRRSSALRVSDVENGVSRELRRRRLR
ncbi:E3 ubiquitin-protein like [Melia azedarach]|uniref:E3 ubiquitin-protein like n=2 Tax=Melia azedarach TaxID=155640 RepID=A0ACC1XK77_MELAZ|nr:E3 ubiquitin-protein like [Melia azedarach]KAJ4711704.1 E3 ubiquitin-protein like [Melia azedarach]